MTTTAPVLPDVPDHIWLTILGYVDDSLQLSKLHFSASIPTVIRRVAGDFQLWKSVRVVNPLNRGRLRKIVSFLGRHTRYLRILKMILFSENMVCHLLYNPEKMVEKFAINQNRAYSVSKTISILFQAYICVCR